MAMSFKHWKMRGWYRMYLFLYFQERYFYSPLSPRERVGVRDFS